jgi:hypothetical protein
MRSKFPQQEQTLPQEEAGNKYKIQYVTADGNESVDWVGIQHITSLTTEKKKKRRKHQKAKKHRDKF